MKQSILIAFLLFSDFVSGVSQSPYFQQYFLLKRNDPMQINSIYQDKAGFMWIGTSTGLFKFDGKNHQQFGLTHNLPNEDITAIAEDSLGRIWVGDSKGRISFFENNHFILFEPREGNAVESISDILFDKNGNLWFGTHNDGLYYFTDNRLYRVDEQEGMPDLYVYDLAEDEKGNIWAGTDGGIAVCKLTGKSVSVEVIDYADGIPDNIIRKIIPDRADAVWLATEDAGVIKFNPTSGTYEPLTMDGWTYGSVSDFIMRGDKLWISCPQTGLLVYSLINKKITVHSPGIQGLSSIKVLAKDTEENIWAGSKYGLLRTPGDNLEFLESPVQSGNSNILAVTVDNDQNLWYSNGEGLYKRKLYATELEIERPLALTPYKKYTVISLYTDNEGFVWAGLYGEGVLRINTRTKKVTYFNKELRNGNILNISGSGQTVWLATLGGCTKIIFQDEQYSIKNYSSTDGLVSDFNYQVYPDGSRVWFASDGKGLGMMDDKGFHRYDKGLPSRVIYGVVRDGKGQLWVNVQDNGLYKFDGEGFHPADSSMQLHDNDIQILTTDKSGNLLVMHREGLDVIDVGNNKVRFLSEDVGLRNKIASLNAVGNDKAGNVFIGTSGGIIKYAGETGFLKDRPIPKIETIKVFDQLVDETNLPRLGYSDNNITISYLGFWYQNPQGLNFFYQLENYDRDWISTKNNSVTYSRLPPGKYTFRLRASDSTNTQAASETSISFTIHTPFWQTIPFYILTTAVLVVGGYGFIKYRERKLRRDNELLEELIHQRTIEIKRQRDEIEARNKEISTKSEEIHRMNENLEGLVKERTVELERKNQALEDYAFINAHKLRSPVATILGLVHLLNKTKLDEDGTEISRRLKSTSDDLDNVVGSITRAIERGDKLIP